MQVWFPWIIAMIFFVLTVGIYFLQRGKEGAEKILMRAKSVQSSTVKEFQTSKSALFQQQRQHLLERRINDYLKSTKGSRRIRRRSFISYFAGLPLFQILMCFLVLWVGFAFLLVRFMYQETSPSLILGGALSFTVSFFILKYFRNRRLKEFYREFPLAYDIISRGLKAGSTIEKSFEIVSQEIPGLVGLEFKRMSEQLEFGVPFQDVLIESAERVDSSDYYFFITSLILQKQSGGSLSSLIINISNVLRKRHELRMKIKSLSAEAKATGIIVGSMPFIAIIAISFFRPEYIDVFRYDPVGQKLFYIVIGLIVTGSLIIRRLIKFKI